MHRKSFLFGFGVSMIMISAVYYLVYQIDIRRLVKNYTEAAITEQLTDDEIRERAKKLGMLAVSELPGSSETETLTDDEIMQRAEELGMVFISGSHGSETNIGQAQYGETDAIPSREEAADDGGDNESDYVSITIPQGSHSSQISLLLYEAGLIPDAHAFDRLTIENNLAKRIDYGEFIIPKNATAEEILDIIKR